MKRIVSILMTLFFVVNCVLGYLAGKGTIEFKTFVAIFIGSFAICGCLWVIGKMFSSDGNY